MLPVSFYYWEVLVGTAGMVASMADWDIPMEDYTAAIIADLAAPSMEVITVFGKNNLKVGMFSPLLN